jgi:8-oxo-dGTP diphosphatase
MKNDALFCIAQKALIEKDGKVLVIFDLEGRLDFPGGKIRKGEAKDRDVSSLIKSLQREVREETNLEIEVFNPFAVWYNELPRGHKNYPKMIYVVAFKCKYVSGELKLSNEHNKFRWVDKSNYQEVDDRSNYFDVLRKYFTDIE